MKEGIFPQLQEAKLTQHTGGVFLSRSGAQSIMALLPVNGDPNSGHLWALILGQDLD